MENISRKRWCWLLRQIGFVVFLVLTVEALLWLISFVSPSINKLLSNSVGAPLTINSDQVIHVLNPMHADIDENGFRNARAYSQTDIVSIGDSQTWGVNATLTDTWPKQLEQLCHLSTYNMGVGGYGPVEYHYLANKALALNPRFVLVGLYPGNDLLNTLISSQSDKAHARSLSFLKRNPRKKKLADTAWDELSKASDRAAIFVEADRLFTWLERKQLAGVNSDVCDENQKARGLGQIIREYSRIYCVIRPIVAVYRVRLQKDNSVREKGTRQRYIREMDKVVAKNPNEFVKIVRGGYTTYLHPAYRLLISGQRRENVIYQYGMDASITLLRDMHKQFSQHGIKLMVVQIPSKELIHESLVADQPQSLRQLVKLETDTWATIKQFFRESGIEYIETLPALRQYAALGKAIYPFTTQSHPNMTGYGVIAHAVASQVCP